MKRSLLLLAVLLATTAVQAADLDVVRQQFTGYLTAAGADRNAPRMAEALSGLESNTRTITAAGFLRDDGSWTDINYDQTPSGSWGPWSHTQRLFVMAKAYQTPGQSFYRDAQLLGQIDAALAWTKKFYGASIIPTGNWWFWTIGIPMDLGPTLVLMQREVNPRTVSDLVDAIQFRIGSSPTARGLVGPTPVAENLVWSCHTHLALGLLKNDAAMLAAVHDAMASIAQPSAGEGIQSDWSFHEHGAQLYTGGYGGQFANDVARYALMTRGTTYGLSAAALSSFASYVADGIAWALYGDYFDVSVVGREVARPSTTGYNGLAALLQASKFDSPRAAEIRAAAAKMLAPWRGTMPTELAALASSVEAAGYTAGAPSGHRHYERSDYTIHRRPGWFASIKMFSTRTKSGEKTNDENLRGARQSDGRMSLVLQGNEYFGGNVWPALDWSRLPGITVELKADTANDTYGYGTRALAGGTGDGRNGVSAMELAPLNSSLTAKKAWFFFDDSIVFLTSGITAPSGNPVETILNQWPLQNATSNVVRQDDWAQLEGIGYWFPTPQSLKVSKETRSGSWAALGASSDTTVWSKPFVTLSIDHGTLPSNETNEYVIVPNVTANAMATWAASRPLSIVANTATVSAARDQRSGALGIAFWSAGAIEGIQSSAAAVVYLTHDGNTLHVWAADPASGPSGSFQLTVPGRYTTSDAAVSRTIRSTTITIARNSGKTSHIVLQPLPPKRRATRR